MYVICGECYIVIIAEVGIQNIITRFANVAPFTYAFTVNVSSLASLWTNVFGANNEVTDERSNVIGVFVRSTDRLTIANNLNSCLTKQESYFYDFAKQTLYINFGLQYNPLLDYSELLKVVGFSDTAVVYVDDIPFLPIIKGSPKLTQKQDMINYDQLAFSMGSITINNQSGAANFLRELNIFSNDVALSFLDYDGRNEHTRSELTPLAWYLVENVDIGKQSGKITLQDVRKTLNGKLPNVLFSATQYPNIETDLIDNPIPLAFGTFTAKAICTNGKTETGNVNYRIALSVQSFTTISVYNSDTETWNVVTPISTNIGTGEFVLSATDARNDKEPREVKVTGIGYDSSKPSKIIARLEYLNSGIAYDESFFNIDEIDTEEATLGSTSLFISEQEELNEIIRKLQEGSTNRFRYEINADGLRTIRLDNLSRASSGFVSREQIKENNELNIYTDKDTVAATIKVIYGNDFTVENKPYVIDSSKEDAIAKSVRERPQIEFDTFLLSRESALARATLEANRLGVVRRFVDVTLCGKEFLNTRIYDIITVELTDVREQWMGVWKCQVLAVAPDTTLYENKVALVLVERVADIDDGRSLRVTTTGAIRKTSTDDNKVRITR